MWFVYLLAFVVLFVLCVPFRIAVLNPLKVLFYVPYDIAMALLHKPWRLMDTGKLNCYMAHFGGGKTLSMAHYATYLFDKYNNKEVWDRGRKCFVTQKVHIISNFELKHVPFEPLQSLSQVVCCGYRNKDIDEKNGTRTVVLVLIDEASVQLNSRNFKTNIDALFLNTLLTCRHYHISMWYSSQKFKLTDALLRSVTQRCVECQKIWRFMVQREYDADEIEYASNPTMVKPRRRYGFFVTNKDFASYDTFACVDNLKKSVDAGDMLSEKEILEMRGELNPDNDAVTHRSLKHKLRKRR